MTDYQLLTIVLSVIGLVVTAFGLTAKILIEWIKDKTSKK